MAGTTTTTGDVPLSSVPEGTRQAASFKQHRLKLFGLVGFIISMAFWSKDLIARFLDGASAAECAGHLPTAAHGFSTLVLLGVFLATKYLESCSASWLVAFDVTALMFANTGFAFMMWGNTTHNAYAAIAMALLITCVVLMARAIIVPTTARATVLVNLAACVPVLILTVAATPRLGQELPPGEPLASTLIWIVTFVTLATIASKVFHGLRTRVSEARRLGQYTLEEKIGEGGMGQVYRASHAMLRRPTAVKLLPPNRVSPEQLARFEREVQRTAELTHANTISVYDYGRTPDGVFYYAMEYLDGVNLEELVRDDGPQPPARVIHILRQACGALAEAHEAGLIHRDIKAANLFLCRRGGDDDVVKVLDFGLVKEVEQEDGSASLVAGNVITGTPLYMSPEAIKSPEELDARSDLYALGAVGYYLLTGEPVFNHETIVEICAAHLHETPEPPTERLAEIPDDLVDVIMACLEKKPGDRPPSAREVRTALDSCATAGAWTEEHMARWWAARTHESKSERPTPAAGTTIDIDFNGRLAGALR